jgi:type IV secretion system protein VirB9
VSGKWLFLALALSTCATAYAEVLPVSGAGDARIRVAYYSPDQVYDLYAFVGYDIRLEFAQDERFVAVDAGDLDAITYSARGNVVSLKPRAVGAEMNLAISTTRHTYYFQYTTLAGRPDPATESVMYVVRFRYPPDQEDRRTGPHVAAKIDAALVGASQDRSQNRNYWFCGAPSLKPTAAWDDGIHTHLTFAPRAELPAIFVGNADGSESLVNFTVESGDLVIHRVAGRFILRRGRLAACIVNKGFSGGSERLKTETVSPDVERETKVPRP